MLKFAGPRRNANERKYGKLHFVASASAENLNIVVNTGADLPDSREFTVFVNGHRTQQLYNALTFNAGDDVQIRMTPWQGDETGVTHFGSGKFFPVFSFSGKNVVGEFLLAPQMRTNSATKVTTLNNMFKGNSYLVHVTQNAFDLNDAVTEIAYGDYNGLFYGCSSLRNIGYFFEKMPVLYYGDPRTNYYGGTFTNCPSVTGIPNGLFDKTTGALSFAYCFYGCSSITAIPVDLFRYTTAVTNFWACFYGCSSITAIPVDLFRYTTAVTNFVYCFSGCSSITAIPVDLFRYTTAVTNFAFCFSGCSSITAIPVDLFRYTTAVTNFADCFRGCSSITAIPVDLFRYTTAVTSFYDCFQGCSSITEIPVDLFRYTTAVTNFCACFWNCTALRDFELYIGSEAVSNASSFCSKNTAYTRIIHVKAGSTTEATFNSVADSCGLTIISDM